MTFAKRAFQWNLGPKKRCIHSLSLTLSNTLSSSTDKASTYRAFDGNLLFSIKFGLSRLLSGCLILSIWSFVFGTFYVCIILDHLFPLSAHVSVTKCWNKKISHFPQSCQKRIHSSFVLKSCIFKIAQRQHNILATFVRKFVAINSQK